MIVGAVALGVLTLGLGALPAADPLTTGLHELDAGVAAPSVRTTLKQQVAADQQRRLRAANDRSSAEWSKITTRAGWESFRQARVEALRAALGTWPAAPKTVPVQVSATRQRDGYQIENLLYESRPGWWVSANLYVPAKPGAAMPGILISHAHHTPKEQGELQDMGALWARAGCLVLVPDHPGHGERRQHPFASAKDYNQSFAVSRQDYYFRYDNALELDLVGESLMGWMAWDLMRGVDVLLARKGIDPKRIILLGAVAGGGDPAAVAGALDERIAVVGPFNFGGPQPETRYPLPADAEKTFNYAGGGSWESTRNLRRSAADGFLPWVIVGSVAPRRLIYGHEFSWDRAHDPVWKRLETIHAFYKTPENLAFTHGKGGLQGRPPEATHCTHIGAPHRRLIYEAFKKWFAIPPGVEENLTRLPSEQLKCWSPELIRTLKPQQLSDLLPRLAAERSAAVRKERAPLAHEEQLRAWRTDLTRLLGSSTPAKNPQAQRSEAKEPALPGVTIERYLLTAEPGMVVPLLLLRPAQKAPGVVVLVAQAGKQALLRERADEIAALLEGGLAVCLPDVRETGETASGTGRGRRSSATAHSATEMMLGGTMLGAQLRDLRTVLAWLRSRPELDSHRLAVWGDSLAPVNAPGTNFKIPRDDDAALPRGPEPLGGLLALLAGVYEDDLRAVCLRGGLSSYRSVLAPPPIVLPHDAVIPGLLARGDLADVAALLAPRPVRLQGMVDGFNRRVENEALAQEYQVTKQTYGKNADKLDLKGDGSSARWLLAQLRKK